jgi:hypothetical protein
MPCNSDYMMPSQKELAALSDSLNELKTVADAMVYSADVIRDVILETLGKFEELTVREALELGRRVAEFDGLVTRGDNLVKEIKTEYAYNNDSRGQKNGNKVIAAYESVRNDYSRAHLAGSALINEQPIPDGVLDGIEKDQEKHRIEDVKRLIPIFTARGDFETVAKLAGVNFTKPLEPQLGFSPDSV